MAGGGGEQFFICGTIPMDFSVFRTTILFTLQILEGHDPPLPIDLDAPYNDEYTVFSRKYNKDHTAKTNEPRRNILITSYNAKNDYASRNLSNVHLNATNDGEERGQFREPIRILNATYSKPSHKTHVEIITRNETKYYWQKLQSRIDSNTKQFPSSSTPYEYE